jgi:FtsH-binding integral membrane protein
VSAPFSTPETIYSGPEIPPRPPHAEASPEELAQVERDVNRFLVHVFGWIVGALLVSALFASYSDRLQDGTIAFTIGSRTVFAGFGIMFVLAFAISRKVSAMTTGIAAATLIGYAAIQGTVFGLAYRLSYGASLAPVYLNIAVVFSALCMLATWRGLDLTSLAVLGSGAALGTAAAISAMTVFQQPLLTGCAVGAGSWLMLALIAYHRNFLRDLPASFEDDPEWWKAAAIGAVQIYLDLVIIIVLVIQTRWLTDFLSRENTTRTLE